MGSRPVILVMPVGQRIRQQPGWHQTPFIRHLRGWVQTVVILHGIMRP